jgi:exosortase
MSQSSPSSVQPSAMRSAESVANRPQSFDWKDPAQRTPMIWLISSTVILFLAYLDMFALTSAAWEDPLYSHGWIVPVFALALMWIRFEPFRPVTARERWTGLAILALALTSRLAGVYLNMNPVDRLSFIVALLGLYLMIGGWHLVRWSGPALGFLVFMFPLPAFLEHNILWRLQSFASTCSTLVLQTLGVPAFQQGNVINIFGMQLLVADACSGLRMTTIFSALAVAMVFLIERPWWDKFTILLSAIPIALLVNIIRVTVTGLVYYWVGDESLLARKLAHDWAGLFMMPLALGILWLELQLLERVTIPVDTAQFKPIGATRSVTLPTR